MATVASMANVTALLPSVEEIPVPPVNLKFSHKATASVVEESSIIVIDEFVSLAFATELLTNCEALIVLFVSVSEPVSDTKLSPCNAVLNSAKVPVIVFASRSIVLFVKVDV